MWLTTLEIHYQARNKAFEMSSDAGWFIDVTALPDDVHGLFQVLLLGCMYGYGLMYAATLISDGSELLLLFPRIAGLVGSVILPVLGAVPDGMIVFFSGIGPDAQNELSVGVGALAGSTAMLLTIPWFLSIVGGRVKVDKVTGNCNYKNKNVPSIMNIAEWTESGVKLTSDVHKGAYVMIISSFSYLLLQVPGLLYDKENLKKIALVEHNWALVGFFCCMVLFCCYMWYSWRISQEAETSHNSQLLMRDEKIKDSIVSGEISLLGAMHSEFEFSDSSSGGDHVDTSHKYGAVSQSYEEDAFMRERLSRLVKPFFYRYDDDKSGSLELEELGRVFTDMGERLSTTALKERFAKFDTDHDGHVDFEEFVTGVIEYLTDHSTDHRLKFIGKDGSKDVDAFSKGERDEIEEEEEEDHEELPEDIQMLPPEEQQRAILIRSLVQMSLGTALVLLLSDPTVDVLNEIGVRLSINPFYVAFVLAPLASNASEVIASYSYSTKKTVSSMTVALSALEGAAIMNNTFVFGIFTLLVYTQELAWRYFAETLAILTVQILVGAMALKKTHTLVDAFLILLIFPLSLLFVALLESVGWD